MQSQNSIFYIACLCILRRCTQEQEVDTVRPAWNDLGNKESRVATVCDVAAYMLVHANALLQHSNDNVWIYRSFDLRQLALFETGQAVVGTTEGDMAYLQ